MLLMLDRSCCVDLFSFFSFSFCTLSISLSLFFTVIHMVSTYSTLNAGSILLCGSFLVLLFFCTLSMSLCLFFHRYSHGQYILYAQQQQLQVPAFILHKLPFVSWLRDCKSRRRRCCSRRLRRWPRCATRWPTSSQRPSQTGAPLFAGLHWRFRGARRPSAAG